MKRKPILITGATGFVGRHVLRALTNYKNVRPLALVRTKELWQRYDWTSELKDVAIIEGSVTEPHVWQDDRRLDGLGGILHLAAVVRHSRDNAHEVYHTNVDGTRNMVRLAAMHRCRLVFVSTSGTVGCFKSPRAWADEHSPYCQKLVASWPYYDSKIQAEKAAQDLADEVGADVVIIRPPVMLGPGDHRFRATGLIIRQLQGKLPFVIKGGMHFIDIRDGARAIVRALFKTKPKPVYHLSGTACRIHEFFRMLEDVSGKRAPRICLPGPLARFLARSSKRIERLFVGNGTSLLPDPVMVEMGSCYWDVRSRYAKEDLGFVSRPARETLADTVAWLRENHKGLSPN